MLGALALLMTMMVGAGTAAAQPVEAVVFELEGAGVDPALLSNLSAVLRNQALQVGAFEVVNATPLQREETAVVLGCEPDARTCLEQMAEFNDARVLISGDVRRRDGGLVVSVAIFDRLRSGVAMEVQRELSGDDPVLAFRREIEGVFGEIAAEMTTHLEVRAPGEGDAIRIDGVIVGHGQVTRQGLPEGRYRVEVERAGARPYVEEVALGVGDPVIIEVSAAPAVAASTEQRAAATSPSVQPQLGGAGPVAEERPERGVAAIAPPIAPRKRSRLGAYSSLGVGVVALGGAGAMVVSMRGIEDDIATENAAGTMTPSRYEELIGRGESYESAQWVLLGVGAGASALGLGWLIVSSARGDDEPALALGVGPASMCVRGRF
ncbi:PEGA domain-containing protein [Lujinxingia vulgaris]|uniref:PEGA domain-containing protein n=1 Tax=Lujinxingia vulgaris TaxID=2600176 RepID=UPI001E39DEFA|nr:PEGA domain-containing protein [Lujinxingia vulgaris]